jgi:hypothetical protein
VLVAVLVWPAGATSLTPLARAFFDGLHFPLFFAATILIHRGFPRERFSGTRTLLALAGGLLLAGIVEGLQALLGREASAGDFLRGASGAALGAIGCFLFSGDWQWRKAYVVTVVAVAVLEFVPAGRLFRAARWQRAQFPVLGDFENPLELRLWTPQGVSHLGEETAIDQGEAFASRGKRAMRVKTAAGGGGVDCYLGRQNWSAFEELRWEIWNPGEPFTLGIRIDDDADLSSAEDRFATAVEVGRGKNAYRLPMDQVRRGMRTRLVNLSSIRRIVFHTEGAPSRLFFLDGLRLERAAKGEED